MTTKGLVNIKDLSTSIIKQKSGIFNPDNSFTERRNHKSGIWSVKDVYDQQKNKTWTISEKKSKVKNQILASSPIYNSISSEKCASSIKLSDNSFCLIYASSDTLINYELFSIETGFSLIDGSGVITSDDLGSVLFLSEDAARVSEISASYDESSNRILACITYGYGVGGGITGGEQVMTSRSAAKLAIGKYNSTSKSIIWSVFSNLYDVSISTIPYSAGPVTGPTPTTTIGSTPSTTQVTTFYSTQVTTFYSTQVTTFYSTQVTTFYYTPVLTSSAGYQTIYQTTASVATSVLTVGPTTYYPSSTSITTVYQTGTWTVVNTITPRGNLIQTLNATLSNTSGTTTITTQTAQQPLVSTTVFTAGGTSNTYYLTGGGSYNTFYSTPVVTIGTTPVVTIGTTPVVTVGGNTGVLTVGTTLLSTPLSTSILTTTPGGSVVDNAPPSQIYSVCEIKNIGQNKFIVSTHGYIAIITLTSDSTYSTGTQVSNSVVPVGGSTELLKTAWDSISNEYVEIAWDVVNSLAKISRYTVSGTTITPQDTSTLLSTNMGSSIGNIINVGERTYLWNDYEQVYQVTHNGTSFAISATPLDLGVIGTINYNTVIKKDNNVSGFFLGYFSNETTSAYNKIVNYLYSDSIAGGSVSNEFSILSSEFSSNNAINYIDLISFEDNVVLFIYEYGSILYANVLQLRSY